MSDQTTSLTTSTKTSVANQSVSTTTYNSEAIQEDINLMMKYAINSGKELPDNILLSEAKNDSELIVNYNNLRKVVQPATVESIRYINTQMIQEGEVRKWHRIPIFSKCVVIAAIALVSLIFFSYFPQVNEENQAAGLLEGNGSVLLLNLAFICSASLLGVMFYLLKTFGDKIRNYTLLPVNAVELNASILIGVISGFVISELFAFALSSIGPQNVEFHKMTLAMLGGFSSDAIFSTLQGVVNKFKSLLTS